MKFVRLENKAFALQNEPSNAVYGKKKIVGTEKLTNSQIYYCSGDMHKSSMLNKSVNIFTSMLQMCK